MAGDEGAVAARQAQHVGDHALGDMDRAAVEVAEVVFEANDAGLVFERQRRAVFGVEQVRRHRGVLLMDEPQVGGDKTTVAHSARCRQRGRGQRMARDDLVEQRHRPRRLGQRRRRQRSRCAAAEFEQATGTDDLRGQRVAVSEQFIQLDRLAARQSVGQAQVGAGQQAGVVGVLAVDALETCGDR